MQHNAETLRWFDPEQSANKPFPFQLGGYVVVNSMWGRWGIGRTVAEARANCGGKPKREQRVYRLPGNAVLNSAFVNDFGSISCVLAAVPGAYADYPEVG